MKGVKPCLLYMNTHGTKIPSTEEEEMTELLIHCALDLLISLSIHCGDGKLGNRNSRIWTTRNKLGNLHWSLG